MTSPIELFLEWSAAEKSASSSRVSGACCLSTLGQDGYPNARFVALKDVLDGAFLVTGPIKSRKGLEISANAKVALTFWWPTIERQVRLQGNASPMAREQAEHYFRRRNEESQIISLVSHQGKVCDDLAELEQRYNESRAAHDGRPIDCPDTWGGFAIRPIRIEFLEFSTDRFHRRTLFQFDNDSWRQSQLEP